MHDIIQPPATGVNARCRIWTLAARFSWAVALLILIVRSAGGFHRTIAFVNFRLAGQHWIHGEALYRDWRGFVYSPFAAASFAPFAWFPPAVGIVIWQLINAGAFLGGLAALLRTIFPDKVRQYAGVVYLLALPLTLGNLDIGHSNLLLIGLLMLGIAAVRMERWSCAALCIALATYLKIYPIAIGMLVCVVAPKKFTWRFLVAILLLAIAPFFLQHWSYVSDQYHAWFLTRSSDNRLDYPIKYAPLDLWYLLHWLGHLPISPRFYTVLQIAGGGAVALVCAWGTWRGWATQRLLIGVLCLGSIWMTLLGPSTESYTYVLLIPALVLALVHLFVENHSPWLRGLVLMAFLLQLSASARSSFLAHFSPLWILAAQPVSALLFLGVCLAWLFKEDYWTSSTVDGVPQ